MKQDQFRYQEPKYAGGLLFLALFFVVFVLATMLALVGWGLAELFR